MRLENFPKTFRITELEKGIFPPPPPTTAPRIKTTWDVPLPSAMYYHPEGMSPGNREKFYEWYNNLVSLDYVFNSQADILRYCQAHVDILRRCCLAFRQLFQQVTSVDRFAKCLTIASACNLVFRRTFFLRIQSPSSLQVFTPEKNQSLIALKLLIYIAQRDNIAIRHARDHGEQRIGKFLVDGYNGETNTV